MSWPAFARLHPDYVAQLDASGHTTAWSPGVDVSGWQTPTQLAEALQWAEWVYVKASEGVDFVESLAADHVAEAHKAGRPYGFYHFGQPRQGDPVREADVFVNAMAGLGGPGQLPPALDLEVGDGNLDAYALAFLRRVEEATGRLPALYTGPGFSESRLQSPELARYPLWLAHYASAGAEAWVPAPWSTWSVWQYASETPEHGHLDVNMARPGFTTNTTTEGDDMALTAEQSTMLKALYDGLGGDVRLGHYDGAFIDLHALMRRAAAEQIPAIAAYAAAATMDALRPALAEVVVALSKAFTEGVKPGALPPMEVDIDAIVAKVEGLVAERMTDTDKIAASLAADLAARLQA